MSNYNYEEGKITGKDEIELYYQTWLSPREKAILVLVHGLGEHSGRYMNLVDQMNGKGVSIYGLDLRGHGKSDGKRGHVSSFLDYVHDLKAFIELIKEKHPDKPIFMFGHSMGGTITCRYTLTYQEDLAGVILSGVGLKPVINYSAQKQGFFTLLSHILPALQQPTGINPELLSHDDEVVSLYQQDELNHDKASLKWFTEFQANCENCINRAVEIRIPILILHGSDDRIASSQGSELLYEKVSSTDKEIKIFDALYHELINEIGKERTKVLTIISKWIVGHTSKAAIAIKEKAEAKTVKKTVKKTTAKKTTAKKTTAKKATAKKTTAKKTTAKKATAKKATAKKTTAKKATAKKTTAKKASAKKTTTKKTTKKS